MDIDVFRFINKPLDTNRLASGLEKAFRDIANATDENELEAGIKQLTAGLKDCKIPADKLKDALKGIYGSQKID